MSDVVLGLNVAVGVLHYAAVTADPNDGVLVAEVPGAPTKLAVSPSLEGSRQLADFRDRFAQDLRDLRPGRVGLLATRANNGWVYRQAVARISVVSAVMLACEDGGVPYLEVKSEPVGRAVGLAPSKLGLFPHASAGFSTRPPHWTAGRAEAFAVTLVLLL